MDKKEKSALGDFVEALEEADRNKLLGGYMQMIFTKAADANDDQKKRVMDALIGLSKLGALALALRETLRDVCVDREFNDDTVLERE